MKTFLYFMIFIVAVGCASTTFSLKESTQDKSALGSCNGYPHGSVIHGYTSKTAPCIEAARTCINGSWNSSEVFSTCN